MVEIAINNDDEVIMKKVYFGYFLSIKSRIFKFLVLNIDHHPLSSTVKWEQCDRVRVFDLLVQYAKTMEPVNCIAFMLQALHGQKTAP